MHPPAGTVRSAGSHPLVAIAISSELRDIYTLPCPATPAVIGSRVDGLLAAVEAVVELGL